MASVKCLYCKANIDRTKEKFIRLHYGQTFRYAHPSCFEKQTEDIQNKYKHELVDPADTVQCIYCKKLMKKSDFDCRPLNEKQTKFAHLLCIQEEQLRPKTDEEELDIYIIRLFDLDYVPPNIKRQIKSFVEKDKLQYSGIKGTLKYFYEIKQNRIDKSNPSIGIVPYVYEDAKRYYQQLAITKARNEAAMQHQQEEKTVTIIIQQPRRVPMIKKLFSFLDEEELNE